MLGKLFKSLERTRSSLFSSISKLQKKQKLSDELLDDIEEQLLLADIGYDTVDGIINIIKDFSNDNHLSSIKDFLVTRLPEKSCLELSKLPLAIFMVGVNGTGKTTSAAKLAKLYKEAGKKVMLIAADTYRAAAIQQLEIWSERAKVKLISNEKSKEPSAVVFDGLTSANASDYDVVIVDTAGRLHTYENLMMELEKMYRIVKNRFPEFIVRNMITIDSLIGQNSIVQAKSFNKIIPLDGVILTKLDSTAKGGIIFSIFKELSIPIKYICTGESIDDIEYFNPKIYLDGLLGKD